MDWSALLAKNLPYIIGGAATVLATVIGGIFVLVKLAIAAWNRSQIRLQKAVAQAHQLQFDSLGDKIGVLNCDVTKRFDKTDMAVAEIKERMTEQNEKNELAHSRLWAQVNRLKLIDAANTGVVRDYETEADQQKVG